MNKKLLRYIKIIVGSVLISAALRFFLIPNNMVLGGVGGLTVVLHHLSGLPAGIILFVLNIPFFFFALKTLGKDYVIHAFLGIVFSSITVDLLAFIPFVATSDPFLIALYSAVLIGFGAGFILSANSSAGGSDMLARIVNKKRPDLSVGQVILVFDFSVVAIGTTVFRNLDNAMYAFFTIFLLIQIIEFILSFARHGKVCYIITEQGADIQKVLVETFPKGATTIQAHGCYSGNEKNILICATRQKQELIRLKRIVNEMDPNAFVIVHDAKEVFGQGFMSLET